MLKQLDSLHFSRWHMYMLTALGTTWVFDGFEVSMLSLVSNQLMTAFDKSESQIGLLASVYLLGCCTGAIMFSCLAFWYGRKQLFNVTLLIYSASVIAISMSPNYVFFAICRFCTGLAVGGEYTAIFAAVDELIPAYVRGRVDIIIDGTWALGGVLASLASLVLYYTVDSQQQWRFQFLVGVLGIVPIFVMRRKIPESPRWLLFKHRQQEARAIVQFIKYNCENNQVMSLEQYQLQSTGSQGSQTEQIEPRSFGDFTAQMVYVLFRKYPSRLFLGLVLMGVQAFFYQGIYYTFAMQLSKYYGVSQSEQYLFMMPLTIAGFLGTIIFGSFFDSIGRRVMITGTYITSGLILICIGLSLIYSQIDKYYYVSFYFVLFLVASPGASSAHLTSVHDIKEMRSQAMAVFFATGLGIGGVISPFFFSRLIQSNSPTQYAYGCFLASSLMIFAGMVGYFLAVDAEQKSLEEISTFDEPTRKMYNLNHVEDSQLNVE